MSVLKLTDVSLATAQRIGANEFTREAFLRAGFEALVHNAEQLTRAFEKFLEQVQEEGSSGQVRRD